MAMGRHRKLNKHLPVHMAFRFGAYYFRGADGRWEHLGHDYGAALRLWSERTGADTKTTIRTMNDAFDRYEREVYPKKSSRSQANNRQQFVRLRKVFGAMRPCDLRPVHGYQYLDALRDKPTAANLEIILLKHVCVYLIRWGVLEVHPLRDVRKLSVPKRMRDVTTAEFLAVRAMASPRMQCAMDMARLTGLREGDILALRRDSITSDGLFVPTHKTGKRLVFEITPALNAVIERLKGLHGTVASIPLFTGRRGQALTNTGFQSEWKRLMKAAYSAGVTPFHFHDLRAMAAAEAKDPQRLLGHTSAAMTATYLRRPTKVKPNL